MAGEAPIAGGRTIRNDSGSGHRSCCCFLTCHLELRWPARCTIRCRGFPYLLAAGQDLFSYLLVASRRSFLYLLVASGRLFFCLLKALGQRWGVGCGCCMSAAPLPALFRSACCLRRLFFDLLVASGACLLTCSLLASACSLSCSLLGRISGKACRCGI